MMTTRKRYRLLILLPVVSLVFAFFYLRLILSPVASGGESRDVLVTIPPQASANQVGKILEEHKIVRNQQVFALYARFRGLDSKIKTGEYRLNNGMSTPEVLQELVEGKLAFQTFTIPEGFTTAQVADLLVSKGFVDREKFFQAVASESYPYIFLKDLPTNERRLEGYLFPDTYQITKGSNESAIINMMLKRFEKELNELNYHALAQSAGLNLHQAVTIASMVEREARVNEERPLIAGVINNRLRLSMPLQIDATIQYALGTTKPKIYYKDLLIDSPYNTYRINGLPPGPIASPGRSSLLAAVKPARTGYLYYVAKPDGTHAFSATLGEHNANKARYLN